MFVCGRPYPDGSEEPLLCPFSALMTSWGDLFLLPMDENVERKRATISDHVHTLDKTQASRQEQLRFKLKVGGEQLDDLISYNQLMENLESTLDTGQTEDGLCRFKSIKDYRGAYSSSDHGYLGSPTYGIGNWGDDLGTPKQHHC